MIFQRSGPGGIYHYRGAAPASANMSPNPGPAPAEQNIFDAGIGRANWQPQGYMLTTLGSDTPWGATEYPAQALIQGRGIGGGVTAPNLITYDNESNQLGSGACGGSGIQTRAYNVAAMLRGLLPGGSSN
jgi:hypothetical protein